VSVAAEGKPVAAKPMEGILRTREKGPIASRSLSGVIALVLTLQHVPGCVWRVGAQPTTSPVDGSAGSAPPGVGAAAPSCPVVVDALPMPSAPLTCLSSGDQTTINQLFASGGQNTIVQLCPRALINLTAPVVFTALGQELSTQGYPTDDARATLVVTGATQATAIIGNCKSCSGIALRNIQVNGNRPLLGLADGGLIEIGGPTTGQIVDHVHSFEPRGWSALHIAEGQLNCAGARITNNDIGPSGQPDGHWADGISMACTKSLVANNTITDATDGAIVLFGAPGTVAQCNTIVAKTRTLLGGINMVDYAPYSGDYTGTVAKNNTLRADGALIKVAIAIGPQVWWHNTTDFNRAGTVENNLLSGAPIGYGIAAAGAQGFVVSGNVSTATFGGDLSACMPPLNAPPMAFVRNVARTDGQFQNEFIAGTVEFMLCIQPGQSPILRFQPGELALRSGSSLALAGGELTLRNDGNLVLSDSAQKPLWSANSSGACANGACVLSFGADGRPAVSQGSTVLWTPPVNASVGTSASLTVSTLPPYMSFADSGNDILWMTSYALRPFQMLAGQYVEQATPSGSLFLSLSASGQLKVTAGAVDGTPALWTSGNAPFTCVAPDCFVVLQGDDNLVIRAGGAGKWASNTSNSGANTLVFNGTAPYLQLVDAQGKVVWSAP
jgi:hypothetical protein